MKKRRFISAALTLLLCIALALPLLPSGAFADGDGRVRAGFFALDGYHMQDEDGRQSGYGYDILQYISGYTALQFDFVGYDAGWSEAQDMLERGEIDVLTSAQKTPERLERFDFSERPIGTSAAILTVKAGSTAYIAGDYAAWSGMRVGMLEGNSRNERFAVFAVEHGFTYTAVFYEDTDAMLDALKISGEVDAVVTSNLRRTEGEWILAQFAASPFYIIVQKGDTELLAELDRALDLLYASMPEIDSLLMDKYYLSDGGHNIAFTVEERDIIEASAAEPVTVGIIPASAPVCYLDKKTGEYGGISMELLSSVASKTGLRFEFVPLDLLGNSPVGWLRAGEVDLVAGILKTQTFMDDETLTLSEGLMTDAVVMVGRRGDDFTSSAPDRAIAVPAGFQMGLEYVNRQFPEHKLSVLGSLEDCMDAVAAGKADAAVYMRTSVSYALQDPHYETLEIVPAYAMEVSTCLAGLSEDKAALMGIVDKGLAMISDSERNAVMLNYTMLNPYELSLGDTLYKFRLPLIVIAALLLCVIAALAVIIVMRRRTDKRLRAAYEQTKEALLTAESASASKSQFLSRMSHEMRTPLGVIIGFMELAKDAEPSEIPAYITNSNIAAKQLLAVINDVLDMSAIEAGKLTLAKSSFDFRQLIHAVTNVYLPQCRQKGLDFEARMLTPVDEWLVGDQLRVNQILFNLLNNAVKFTDSGHVWLSVSQTPVREGQVMIRLQVSDTGRGMSEDMRSRLFKPFEQENAADSIKYGGSGLGLSIVKNLVTLMNGAIRVESAPGKGSEFTVDLPFGLSDAAAELKLPDDGKALRVLAVDDEETERKYLNVVLNKMGVRHDCVPGGAEALEALHAAEEEGDPYQICLVDWKMPGMDGAETTRRIRESFGANVLVIVVSAYEHNSAAENARAAGASIFIPKPLFRSSLFDLFMTMTGGRMGAEAAGAAGNGRRDFAGRRVLLAEDNAMNRMVAEAMLKRLGVLCESAEDGAVAAEKFIASPKGYYDAVLMDIQMPNADGFEATARIRASAHPEAGTVRIIALTANAFTEDIAKSLSAGMNAHVSKPIEAETLARALENAFFTAEKQ